MSYFERVAAALTAVDPAELHAALDMLRKAREGGHAVYTCGNGGSAATASHFACDLAKNTFRPDAPPIRAICLTDSIPLLTAFANDGRYERAFHQYLWTFAKPSDVLVAISTSGYSSNVVLAIDREVAHQTIVLTGRSPSPDLVENADVVIHVPADEIEVIEDVHLSICHWLTRELRETPTDMEVTRWISNAS